MTHLNERKNKKNEIERKNGRKMNDRMKARIKNKKRKKVKKTGSERNIKEKKPIFQVLNISEQKMLTKA